MPGIINWADNSLLPETNNSNKAVLIGICII